MHDDPRLDLLARTLQQRPAVRLRRQPEMREAAVALLIRPRDDLELLLIKRAEHESDPWSGHIALPGGRRQVGDADLRETALRETEEEIAVPAARVGRLLGTLDELAPFSQSLPQLVIAPFVVGVPADTTAIPEPREVDAALWVPLASLRSDAAVEEYVLQRGDERRIFPSLRYESHVIWGLTHRILTQFLQLADACGL